MHSRRIDPMSRSAYPSLLVPPERRTQSPLAGGTSATACSWKVPLSLELGGEQGTVFLTGCPREVLDPGRTWDEEGLIRTIDDARKSICVSVMDFAPVGIFDRKSAAATAGSGGAIPYDTPVWWSSLFDALLSAVVNRQVLVLPLGCESEHTFSLIATLPVALQNAGDDR